MGQMDERQMSKVEFDTMFSSLGLEAAEIWVIFKAHRHARIALGVAMETMHFHIAQTDLGELCFAFRGSWWTIWQSWKKVLVVQNKLNLPPDYIVL